MKQSQPFIQALEAAVAPVVAAANFELLTIEAAAAGRVLRLYIDRPVSDGGVEAQVGHREASQAGVTIDDCARVSRLVSDWLDTDGAPQAAGENGWLAGRYTLEVSSPGLDRPLCRPAHFRRFVGARVVVHTQAPVADEGRRRLTGLLTAAAAEDDGRITLDTSAGATHIAYPSITRARLVPDIGPRATKESRHGR